MTTAAEIEYLIDPCGFGPTVLGHLQNDPEIQNIVVVNESVELAEAGAAFIDGDEDRIHQWLETKAIQLVVEERRDGREKLISEIPFDRMVYVLYLPPFYLVKETDRVWE